ncbi:MAG: serine hydrolase [Clostridia bacterium]|nr:serine hydrolase [Clostridia bacterium]
MMERFEKALTLAKTLPGSVGIYLKDTVTGEEGGWQEHLPVVAASVIKIPIMMEAFRQREAGLLDFTQEIVIRAEDHLPSCGALTYMHDGLSVQVRDLVTLMIILSDNTATNKLIDILGLANIQKTIEREGLGDTVIRRKLFMAEMSRLGIQNQITAYDMGLLLERIHKGTLISEAASGEMRNILLNQRLNGKMPFFLHSQDIACAHKTGEDDGITHDVGLIYAEHPLIFCFVSEHTDVPIAERAIQDIARLITFGDSEHLA